MIGRAVHADLLARSRVFRVRGIHGTGTVDLLKAQDPVAEIRIGHRSQIVPLRRALRLGHRLHVFMATDKP